MNTKTATIVQFIQQVICECKRESPKKEHVLFPCLFFHTFFAFFWVTVLLFAVFFFCLFGFLNFLGMNSLQVLWNVIRVQRSHYRSYTLSTNSLLILSSLLLLNSIRLFRSTTDSQLLFLGAVQPSVLYLLSRLVTFLGGTKFFLIRYTEFDTKGTSKFQLAKHLFFCCTFPSRLPKCFRKSNTVVVKLVEKLSLQLKYFSCCSSELVLVCLFRLHKPFIVI